MGVVQVVSNTKLQLTAVPGVFQSKLQSCRYPASWQNLGVDHFFSGEVDT